jgi:hypothetical protein
MKSGSWLLPEQFLLQQRTLAVCILLRSRRSGGQLDAALMLFRSIPKRRHPPCVVTARTYYSTQDKGTGNVISSMLRGISQSESRVRLPRAFSYEGSEKRRGHDKTRPHFVLVAPTEIVLHNGSRLEPTAARSRCCENPPRCRDPGAESVLARNPRPGRRRSCSESPHRRESAHRSDRR